MTNIIKVPKETILDGEVLYSAIEDNIIDTSRWSEHHEAVIPWNGKFYRVYYSCGATECQDETPFEYEKEVTLTEVEQKEVLIKKWVDVE